jgi:hypothetical protein
MHTSKPGLVWSGLITKLFAQPVIDHVKAEQHSELMRKVSLVPSPLSYQFLSSHSLFVVYCPPTNMFSS